MLLLLLLTVAVAVLFVKVQRLERMLEARNRNRSKARSSVNPKVIPLLKENIEPGPFKAGNEKRRRESGKDPGE